MVDPACPESVHPDIHAEEVCPGVKERTVLIGILNYLPESPITAGKDTLEHGSVGLMPHVADALLVLHGANFIFHDLSPGKIILLPVHRRPLEGCERLRHEEGGRDGDLAFAVAFGLGDLVVIVADCLGQMGDALHVVLRLGRQSQHKVELDLVPAAVESRRGPLHDILFRDALVDDIAEPLRAGLRREGQGALLDILHLLHHIEGEIVDAEGRQGNIDGFCPEIVNEVPKKLRKLRVIAGA